MAGDYYAIDGSEGYLLPAGTTVTVGIKMSRLSQAVIGSGKGKGTTNTRQDFCRGVVPTEGGTLLALGGGNDKYWAKASCSPDQVIKMPRRERPKEARNFFLWSNRIEVLD